MTTQTDILNRFHTINTNVLTTVTSYRYFVPELFANTGQQPWIVPYVRSRNLNNRTSGAGGRFTTYTVEQFCAVGAVMKGLPSQTTGELTESIMEDVEVAYAGRLNLDYDGNRLVHQAIFNGASVPRVDPQRGLTIIIFSHTVTTFASRTIGG